MTEVIVSGLDINSRASVAPVGTDSASQARAVKAFSALDAGFHCGECPAGKAIIAKGQFAGPTVDIAAMLYRRAVFLQCMAKGATNLRENCADGKVAIEY